MADRQVTKTRKDEEGDILALCDDAAFWSPRAKQDAITDIERGYTGILSAGQMERRLIFMLFRAPLESICERIEMTLQKTT